MNINYGIVAVDKETEDLIYHFCGYENPPTDADWKSLAEELETDSELAIQGPYVLIEAPLHVVVHFRHILEGARQVN